MNLYDISSPDFLKQLDRKELQKLSEDIRLFIIEQVSQTGGHLSSNLGVIELTIALHYVFNSPHDKLIFDVGHQSYTHKILTGRAHLFSTLRQKDGLSGYIKYNESIHDVWEAGHASTSISAAAGFLEAKSAGEDIGEVVSIIGDGSIPNGLSLEGINYLAAKPHQKTIIILNDNDMSISKNVGRLAKSLSKIRIKRTYSWLKSLTPKFIHRLFRNLKDAFKLYVYGNNVFSTLGYKYYGPIDGHNLQEMIRYFEFAKKSKTSVFLHVKTKKGKGYEFAERDGTGAWHGVGPFDILSGATLKKTNGTEIAWGEGISQILLQTIAHNPKIRVITPAMISGSYLEKVQQAYPEQLLDVGIAEEHAVVMAASMSRMGLIPIVAIYSTFLQRAYDEICHDVCRSRNHVIFLIDRAGINGGGDGSTHQGIFDIAFLSHLPHMMIAMPKNLTEAQEMIQFAIHQNEPIAIRYPKGMIQATFETNANCDTISWVEEKPIQSINIVTYGPMVNAFYEQLPDTCGLINARFIKPIDHNMLEQLNHTRVLVVEEVVENGSLGSKLSEIIQKEHLNIQIECYSLGDQYIDNGTADEIRKELNIDVESILKKI